MNNYNTMATCDLERSRYDSSKYILLALVFVVLYQLLMAFFRPVGLSTLKVGIVLFLVFSVMAFVLGAFHEYRYNAQEIHSRWMQIFWGGLILWGVATIIRDITTDKQDLMTLFGNHYTAWAWITPLAVLYGRYLGNWQKCNSTFVLITGLASAGVTVALIWNYQLAFILTSLLAIYPYLLFTWKVQSNRTRFVAIWGMICFLCISFIESFRTGLLSVALSLVFFGLIRLREINIANPRSAMLILIIVCLFSTAIFYGQSMFETIEGWALGYEEGLYTDSRSFLFREMLEDLSGSERFIGRGALGRYWSTYFASPRVGGDAPERIVVEVGYLQMFLKGGYVMVGLFLLVTVPAAWLGIFRSENCITRACGFLVLGHLLIAFILNIPSYSLNNILLWLSVGACWSDQLRATNDDQVLATDVELLGEEEFDGQIEYEATENQRDYAVL